MNDSDRDLSQFRKLSAYIMQDNQLHANLTVDEAMAVAAKLKIGQSIVSDRQAIVSINTHNISSVVPIFG